MMLVNLKHIAGNKMDRLEILLTFSFVQIETDAGCYLLKKLRS